MNGFDEWRKLLSKSMVDSSSSDRLEEWKHLLSMTTADSSATKDTDSVDSMMTAIFPIAQKAAAKTIGFDLVSGSDEWDVYDDNDNLVESVGGFGKPMSAPSGKLFFMDYIRK